MNTILALLFTFVIAAIYASAGFGGASGYLLATSFIDIPVQVMASTALLLNVLVSSVAFTRFTQAGHFRPRLLIPFLITSIPASFIGGYIHIPEQIYMFLLNVMLTYLAIRFVFFRTPAETDDWTPRELKLWVALASGLVIGLLSGMLGIGGGIFLSPLILLAQWGNSKQAAASAGGFIAINSISALIGRMAGGTFMVNETGLWLLPAGLLGALLGSQLGTSKFSGALVRRALGIVLSIAVFAYWIRFFE